MQTRSIARGLGSFGIVLATAGCVALSACSGKVILVETDGGLQIQPTATGTTTATTTATIPTATSTNGYDAGSVYQYDGGTFGDGGFGDTCPVVVAPGDLPSGWKPPAAASTVCTQGDIAAFDASLKDPNGTDATIKASVTNAACNACIFSKSTDANWTPLVDYPDGMGGTSLIINNGACFAGAPGGSAACGQGFFDADNCSYAACPTDTCVDQQGCLQAADAAGGTCAQEQSALGSGCGSALQALDTECFGNAMTLGDAIVREVTILCGGGSSPTDAGGG